MKMINLLKAVYYKFITPNKYAEIVGVQMGKNCQIRTKYFGSEPYLITMGDNVSTSGNVQFITHDGAIHVLRNLFKEYKKKDLIQPIIIGNNVFIGVNVVVLPGTIIEDNVIVGAGSLVKGLLLKNSVYAGVPSKFICTIEDYKDKNKDILIETKGMTFEEKKSYLIEWINK